MLVGTCIRRSPRSCIQDEIIACNGLRILCGLNFLVKIVRTCIHRNTQRIEANLAIARTERKLGIGFGKAATALPLVMHHATKATNDLVFFGHIDIDRRSKSLRDQGAAANCERDFIDEFHTSPIFPNRNPQDCGPIL